ncbi:MAG TPA: alpha/beta hydrolase [Solirubrobacterales bacterium]|nr:alpha/beta hydrolase [Solirubrobacterales bacterium]
MSEQRREVKLPAGTIRYREAGEGKPVVFVHGFLVDGRLWNGVVDRLSDRFRCLAPDWPLGAHQVAMDPDADLTPPDLAGLIAEFIDRLELEDVTIVGNDSGGAISQILAANHPEGVARLALTNCDTHENFPPGVFKAMPPLAKLPGGMQAMAAPFRVPAMARRAFAPFARTRIPDDLIASWMYPATHDSGVMHDTRKVTAGMNQRHTLAAAKKLQTSEIPLRLLWAPGDKFFPMKYAERLASEVPNSEIVQIPDAKTFVPLDQPGRVADELAAFVG